MYLRNSAFLYFPFTEYDTWYNDYQLPFLSVCQSLITELRIVGYYTQLLLRELQLGSWNDEICLTFLLVPANQGV
jgi:hypothetical protein